MRDTKSRIRELENRLETLEEEVVLNRRSAEKRLATVTNRVHKLEKLAFESSLDVEAELSQMERILCGLDDEPPVSTRRYRAVILVDLWNDLNISDLTVGDVVNLEKQNLKTMISREERRASGTSLEGTLSNKQIARAMDAFVEMFDGKAERRKNANTGVNEVLIREPDEIVWTREELRDRIQKED